MKAVCFTMTEFGNFPFDCCQHVFSYLELVDCLRFSSTSSVAMREVLPAILIRRSLLLKPYAMFVQKCINPSPPQYGIRIGLLDDLSYSENERLFYIFPSLHQRVTQLVTKIPPSHPLCSLVKELSIVLSFSNNNTILLPNEDLVSIQSLIKLLQYAVSPLKLHATILNRALLSKNGDNTMTTELQHYIGDVLCVTYLFYDFGRKALYAEGSLSIECLQKRLCRCPPSCYQSWVLMHACILRTKQFTEQQLSRMGLGDIYMLSNHSIPEMQDLVAFKTVLWQHSRQFGWNMTIDKFRTDQFMKSEMCLIYDDFGPLGPSFRGRDIVRVRDVTADAIQECLINEDILYGGGGNIQDAIEWICLAHEQSHKNRPMTVRQPVVRFG